MDSGDDVLYTVPICDGYVLLHTNLRLDLAGRNFYQMSTEDPHRARVSSTTPQRGRSVVMSKRNFDTVFFWYDTELKSTAARSDSQIHMLSDGNIITVGAERFRCETFFSCQVSVEKKPVNPRVLGGSRVHPALKHSQIKGARYG